MSGRAHVNAGMLAYARAAAGLTLETAAAAAGMSGDALGKVEAEQEFLTPRQARLLAKKFGCSFAYLYADPPAEPEQAPHQLFRHFYGIPTDERKVTPELLGAAREALEVHDLALELMAELGDEPTFREVVAADPGGSPETVAQFLREALDVDAAQQRAWQSDSESLKAWRAAVERLGVLVMQASFVPRGSKAVSPVRGFLLVDDRLPVVVLNRHDPEVVQNFTLMHEVVHALLQARGAAVAENESICNRLAAAVLMPPPAFTAVAGPLFVRLEPLDAARAVGRRLYVSPTSALIRAADLGLVDRQIADAIIGTLLIGRRKGGGSGPVENSEGRKAINRYGRAYVELVIDALRGQQLTYDVVPSYLGMKVERLPQVEAELARSNAA